MLSLASRWIGLVPMKMWIRLRSPPEPARSPKRSMSLRVARASEQMIGPSIVPAIPRSLCVARRGGGEARLDDVDPQGGERLGDAQLGLSVIEKPGACSPSRSVVSKMRIWVMRPPVAE
jgi:hypothetical protein